MLIAKKYQLQLIIIFPSLASILYLVLLNGRLVIVHHLLFLGLTHLHWFIGQHKAHAHHQEMVERDQLFLFIGYNFTCIRRQFPDVATQNTWLLNFAVTISWRSYTARTLDPRILQSQFPLMLPVHVKNIPTPSSPTTIFTRRMICECRNTKCFYLYHFQITSDTLAPTPFWDWYYL